jgi:hypothetical protein
MKRVPIHSALATIFGLALLNGGTLTAALSQDEFRTPPIAARPSCFWSWLNGNVDRKQITRELEEMKAKGMRGGIIWDIGSIADPNKIIPVGPQFLGPESLKSIHHTMDEAQRLGLELGIFASSSWNAGGTWITPEDGSKSLLWSELGVTGSSEFSGTLPLPKKASAIYQDIAIWAVPDYSDKSIADTSAAVRLDARLAADGKLNWSVPTGAWRILRFIQNNTGEFLNCPSPNSRGLVIDHLSRPATEAHFNYMLDTISKGRDGFGPIKVFELDSYEVHQATDWTPDFVKAFIARNHYDPTPWLPVLAGWTVGSKELSERFEHDYHKMVSDLIIENHFARAKELLNQRGLQLLAEAGHGGSARVDPLKALGAADIPMGEFWNHRKNWVTKEAASAANIYGKRLVNAESFTGWQNWQDGPAAYKRLLDIALCAGLNQVTFHTFAHNPPEAGLPGYAYHAGEHFNVNSTWWHQAGPMIEDMSRCCHLLQQGLFVADVCAYYGDNAPNLVPARRIAPTIKSQWSDDKCAHCGRPKPVNLDSLGHSYDYDYINEDVILNRMKFQNGKFVFPDGMSYRLLVLPDRKTIAPAVLRRLGEFVRDGATIVGPKPERSNSLKGYPDCDREVRELAAQIWANCDGEGVRTNQYGKGRVLWNVPLTNALADLGVAPDFVAEDFANADRHIDYIHRATAEEDIYFVSNSSTNHVAVTCRFRVGAGRSPSFWNAENGTVTPCFVYETKDGFTRIPIELAPASSIFVVFAKGPEREHLVEVQHSPQPEKADSSANRPAIEILELENGKVRARAQQPGEYHFKTTSGRTGKWVVKDVPDEQAITGPWRVAFPTNLGEPAEITMPELMDWTTSTNLGVKYFSGSATYRNQLVVTNMTAVNIAFFGVKPVILDLGSVKEVAVVRVNGKEAGVLWKEPRRVDIGKFLRVGANDLEITVVNTWNNRIVGDAQPGVKKKVTRTNIANKFNANSPLLSSGLLGPVRLEFPVSATCELK